MGSSTTGLTARNSSSACLCTPGWFGAAGHDSCAQCPMDTFKSTDANSAVCSSCPNASTTIGSIGRTLLTDCVCASGYAGNSQAGCLACPIDTYKVDPNSGSAAIMCAACEGNSTTNGLVGRTSYQSCMCKAGFFGLLGGASCQLCPDDSFKTLPGNGDATTCSSCAQNSEVVNGAIASSSTSCLCSAGYFGSGHTDCSACPENTYKGTVASNLACTSCPSGSSTSGLTASDAITDCVCAKGYSGSLQYGGCNPCAVDTYKDVDMDDVCDPCDVAATTNGSLASRGADACMCRPGYFGSNNTCSACPVNTFASAPGTGTALTRCIACAGTTDTQGVAGASSPQQCICPAGQYGNGGDTCTLCPAGSYKTAAGNGNSSACILCPPGATTLGGTGSVTYDDCLCAPGYYGSGATCLACPSDTFKTDSGNGNATVVCTACAIGTTTGGVTAASTSSSCLCPAGKYGSGNSLCYVCPVDTYKATAANGATTVCNQCPTGSTTNGQTGVTSVAQCVCNPGWYRAADGTCAACPVDTFKAAAGNADISSCLSCPVRSSTVSQTGQSSITQCHCIPGSYGNVSTGCVSCPANSFQAGYDASSCSSCASNSTTDGVIGRSSSTSCSCLAGYFGTVGHLSCQACPADTYKASSGNGACTLCTRCSANTTTAGLAGQSTASSCVCLPGYYGLQSVCSMCPKDTYKVSSGNGAVQDVCTPCLEGSTTGNILGAVSASQCICGRGFVRSGQICVPCTSNTFKDSIQDSTQCTACGDNSTTAGNIGSINSTACVCKPGYYGLSGHLSCQACPTSTFKTAAGSGPQSVCSQCDALSVTNGTSPATSSDMCQCAAGAYRVSTNGPCALCPADHYKDFVSNALSCLTCPSNMITIGAVGTTSVNGCICASGYFMDNAGNCQSCPADTYKASAGDGGISSCISCASQGTTAGATAANSATACLCKSGYYGSGETSCQPCPVNTFKVGIGNGLSSQCTPCPSNTVTQNIVGVSRLSACVCPPGYYGDSTEWMPSLPS